MKKLGIMLIIANLILFFWVKYPYNFINLAMMPLAVIGIIFNHKRKNDL
jgi:hypothetical protein